MNLLSADKAGIKALLSADKAGIRELEKLKEAARQARQTFDRDYWLNAAFYTGSQYVDWADARGRMETVAPDANTPNAPRPVANKIMHFTVKSHSEAMLYDPRPEVMAPSTDARARSTARVAQAYLDDLAGPTKMDWAAVRADVLMWANVCGQGWLKWIMDPQLRRPDVIACSPFEVYLDPYVKDSRRARYIIHSQFLDREQVYDRFAVELPESAQQAQDPNSLGASVLSEMGYAPNLGGVMVNELWQLPSRRFPRGRFVAWTGSGKLLTPIDGPFPYRHKKLPFTQIGYIPVPGNANYHSTVKFLRPPQMELNAVHAQMLVNRKAYANPKWFWDAELYASLVHPPTDLPGEQLIGDSRNGSIAPIMLQGALMADDGTAEWVTSEMRDIVGQHSVSEGDAPGRVDSARAIELLKAEDNSALSNVHRMMDTAVSVGFGQLLQLAGQYVSEAQIATTYTTNGQAEVHHFKGAIVSPDHVVRVAGEAKEPQSRAAREEQILSWWTAGILTDPKQAMQLLEVSFAGSASSYELDKIRATNENFLLSNEVPVQAHDYDDHEVHIAEHQDWQKTAEYEAATNSVHDLFKFHIQSHKEQYMVEMQEEALKQRAIAAMTAPTPTDMAADPTLAPPVQAPAPPAQT